MIGGMAQTYTQPIVIVRNAVISYGYNGPSADYTPQPVRESPLWVSREGWLTMAARSRRRRTGWEPRG